MLCSQNGNNYSVQEQHKNLLSPSSQVADINSTQGGVSHKMIGDAVSHNKMMESQLVGGNKLDNSQDFDSYLPSVVKEKSSMYMINHNNNIINGSGGNNSSLMSNNMMNSNGGSMLDKAGMMESSGPSSKLSSSIMHPDLDHSHGSSNCSTVNGMDGSGGGGGNGGNQSMEDQRALQLALELSMLGLTNEDEHAFNDPRLKKSMNMTECVPVPSSEHVAEIVGRQGCKIKALRAKTNTYIKTPVRGEEPVFVVTGRKEDVCLAKQEILQAAEHFSQIRASRRNSASLSPLGPPSPTAPGHITKQVRVPYRVVGLVVGPKGSTIKRIQQATNTYIVTPSRDKEPVFEVTGLPDNVDRAKREVEHHIALRTGGIIDPTHPETNDHMLSGLFSPTGSSSSVGFSSFLDHNHPNHMQPHRSQSAESFGASGYYSGSTSGAGSTSKFSDLGSSTASPFSNNTFFYDNVAPSPTTDSDGINQFDPTPGSPSPSLWPDVGRPGDMPRPGGVDLGQRPPSEIPGQSDMQRNSLINRAPGHLPSMLKSNRSISVGGYGSNNDSGRSSPAQIHRMMAEKQDSFNKQDHFSAFNQINGGNSGSMMPTKNVMANQYGDVQMFSSGAIPEMKAGTSDGESATSSPDWMNRVASSGRLEHQKELKNCLVCHSNKVVAALVPCGHNLFCMECAENVKDEGGSCPACSRKVEAILRIFS